jgi:5-formyltetrahydrofolate cyclo-ligase
MLLRALRDLVLPRLPVEGIVASYSAYGDEIDPAPVAAALPGRAALPWFAGRDAPMRFRLWDGGPLDSGPFNIPQPTHGEFVDPDILLVPLVAADPRCHRLGQGKGHYDRALAALAGHKTLHTIGLAWEVQLIAEVPTDPWDIPLDAIATPLRWLTPVA